MRRPGRSSRRALDRLDGVVIARPLQNKGLGSALLEDFCMRMANFGFEVVRTNFYRRNFYLNRAFVTDERWGGQDDYEVVYPARIAGRRNRG